MERSAQKEQMETRWWWRWHAKEARIGKRIEPVVRRHLAAPYIFLFLPRRLPSHRLETTSFPFLVVASHVAEDFHVLTETSRLFTLRA